MDKIEFQEELYSLLALLKKNEGEYISGEELSRRFKISRTALWKKINYLRTLGYEIVAHKSTGYSLKSSPDIPYPWEIYRTNSVWQKIIYYPSVESTNTEARFLAEKGIAGGTVLIAEKQTGGRGRMGRVWVSPPAGNIYLSLILRPEVPPFVAPQFTLSAGVGVARTVEEVTGLKPEIKWPNDLLLNKKKFSGILTELNSETDRVNFIIVGIGINLNSKLDDYPEELRNELTTLRTVTEKKYRRNEFIIKLLDNLENVFRSLIKSGFCEIKKEWEKYFCMKDENVVISFQNSKLHGRAVGIDDTGAFLLRLESGKIERVLSGDVIRLRSN